MMPEWHQLDSSSTMPQQQESTKKKNFKIKSRSFWFSTGLIGQDSQYQTVILGTDFSIRSLHYNTDPVPTMFSFIQRLQNI